MDLTNERTRYLILKCLCVGWLGLLACTFVVGITYALVHFWPDSKPFLWVLVVAAVIALTMMCLEWLDRH